MRKSEAATWWPTERAAWTPPEDLTVSEVADKYRVLSYKAEKRGPWETSYVPPIRAYQDAFGLECVEEVWIQSPTQVGKTEGCLNMMLYAVLQDPGDAMVVEPNESLADELSKDRVDDMIRHSERLQDLISENREETGKKKKTFRSMTIYFAWAGSPTSLASRPIRYCFFDEVGKYPAFSGKEASPLSLGKERTNTFKRARKLIYASTPTIETGYITVGEAACEARFRYLVACQHCGHRQKLTLEQIKFGDDHTPSVVRDTAWYECAECGGEIRDDRRMELVRRGQWYAMTVENGREIYGLPFDEHMARFKPRSVGFQFNRLYTPWFSFGDVAAEFLTCKDNPTQFMNFRNSWMAEPWVDRAEVRTEDAMIKRCTDLPARICPDNTIAVVTGCDPGQKGLWYLSIAVLKPKEYHVIDYGHMSFVGKTVADQGAELRKLVFDTRYQRLSGGWEYPIWRCGVDTGGGKDAEDETQTTRAYAMIRAATDGKRLFGTKGRSTIDAAVVTKRIVDKMPGKEGKAIPGGLLMWLLNTDSLKNSLNYYLGLPPGTHGAVTFHRDTQADLVRHILAEERQRDRQGKWSWVQVHRDNHLLDCLIIALAMADRECWGGTDILKRPQRIAIAAETEAEGSESGDAAEQMERRVPWPEETPRKPQTLRPGKRTGWFGRGRNAMGGV